MKNRIRALRKQLGLNQTDFGERIGIKQTTVAGYETGAKNPRDAVILSICKEFNVNEEWLRTGKGDMFQHLPEEDETAAFVSELLFDNDNELYTLIKEIMRTYAQLDEKSKEVLKQFSKMLLDNLGDTKKQTN